MQEVRRTEVSAPLVAVCRAGKHATNSAQFPISRKNWLVGVMGTVALLIAPMVLRGYWALTKLWAFPTSAFCCSTNPPKDDGQQSAPSPPERRMKRVGSPK